MAKFHAQIWQVGKSTRICLELWPMVLKQSVKAHEPLVFFFWGEDLF